MSATQTVENIKQILKETMIPDQALFEVEREIDRYELPQAVKSCTNCALHSQCYQPVPGIGAAPADIMMVAESPGEQDDSEGVPFVGPAGQLFDQIIKASGWKREEIYITNVIKCRPGGDRNPTKAELAACYQHLKKEIEIVMPKVIICWGAIAASVLIHPDFRITKNIGRWYQDGPIRKIAVYQPAYLLRLGDKTRQQIQAKRQVWEAMKKVIRYQENGFKE